VTAAVLQRIESLFEPVLQWRQRAGRRRRPSPSAVADHLHAFLYLQAREAGGGVGAGHAAAAWLAFHAALLGDPHATYSPPARQRSIRAAHSPCTRAHARTSSDPRLTARVRVRVYVLCVWSSVATRCARCNTLLQQSVPRCNTACHVATRVPRASALLFVFAFGATGSTRCAALQRTAQTWAAAGEVAAPSGAPRCNAAHRAATDAWTGAAAGEAATPSESVFQLVHAKVKADRQVAALWAQVLVGLAGVLAL
jgi:hypothetical protein